MSNSLTPCERLMPNEPRTSPWRVFVPLVAGYTPIGDRLSPGGVLRPGQQLRRGVYTLSMRYEGRLVLDGRQDPIEAPLIAVVEGSYAELRPGGNFVVCVPNGSGTLWESGPMGPGDLVLEADGSVTIGGIPIA